MKNNLKFFLGFVIIIAFILSSISIIGQTHSAFAIIDKTENKNQSLPSITFYAFDAFIPVLNSTIDKMVADFNANYSTSYGFKVNLVGDTPGQPTDTHDIFLASFQSKSTRFDVYTMDVLWPVEFASAGYLLPLNDVFNTSYQAQFLQADIAAGTYNGQLYAVPWTHNSGMLYYRSDILHYAFTNGIIPADRPPQTWSELSNWTLAMLHDQALVTKFNITSGFVWQGRAYEGLMCDLMEYLGGTGTYSYIASNQIEHLGTTGSNSFLASNQSNPEFQNSSGLQTALRYMKSLITSGVSPVDVLNYDEETSRAVWNDGNAIFMRNWPYAYPLSLRSAQLNGSLVTGAGHNIQQFNVTVMPAENSSVVNPKTSCLGGLQLSVNAYSTHPNDAKKFIMWLTASKQQQTYFLGTGNFPSLKAVYNSPTILHSKQAYVHSYLPIFESSIPRPISPKYSQISFVMLPVIHNYLGGEITLEKAITNMTTSVNSIGRQNLLSLNFNDMVLLGIGIILAIVLVNAYSYFKKRRLRGKSEK